MTGESVDEMSLSSLPHHLISSQCSTDGYDSMTVARIKELCKEAGISSSGKKKAEPASDDDASSDEDDDFQAAAKQRSPAPKKSKK